MDMQGVFDMSELERSTWLINEIGNVHKQVEVGTTAQMFRFHCYKTIR